MSQNDAAMHYVCTHEKARDLIKAHSPFWVSNCGCRESRGGCARSRMDVCLIFNPDDPGSGTGKKPVSLRDVMGIVQEAESKHLVARPYRNAARTDTDGYAFVVMTAAAIFWTPVSAATKVNWWQ